MNLQPRGKDTLTHVTSKNRGKGKKKQALQWFGTVRKGENPFPTKFEGDGRGVLRCGHVTQRGKM